jgi:hypothetical protein
MRRSEAWPPWTPTAGDLVRFHPNISNHPDIPVRVPRPTQHGYVKDHIRSTWLFLVLGQLDHEEKLAAAYAQEQAGDLDPVAPDTHQAYFWCLCGEGIVVLTRGSLAPA